VTAAVVRVADGLERVAAARQDALVQAVVAVRALEASLVRALGGGALRGLPILAWPRFRAAAVVAPPARGGPAAGRGIDTRVPRGREVMVVLPRGELAWAWMEGPQVQTRGVLDRELRGEDLANVADAVLEAAGRHAERCDRTAEGWRGVADLAARLRGALAG
jgi:hypothetical protein